MIIGTESSIHERIRAVQSQIRIAIQNHHVLYERIQVCPKDAVIENHMHILQDLILSMGRTQLELMSQFKQEIQEKHGTANLKNVLSMFLGWPERQEMDGCIKPKETNGFQVVKKKQVQPHVIRQGGKMQSLLKPSPRSILPLKKDSERQKAVSSSSKSSEYPAAIISSARKLQSILKSRNDKLNQADGSSLSRRSSFSDDKSNAGDVDNFSDSKLEPLAETSTPRVQDKATKLEEISQELFLGFFGLLHKDKSKNIVVNQRKRKRRSAAGQSNFYNDYLQPRKYTKKAPTPSSVPESPSSSQDLLEVEDNGDMAPPSTDKLLSSEEPSQELTEETKSPSVANDDEMKSCPSPSAGIKDAGLSSDKKENEIARNVESEVLGELNEKVGSPKSGTSKTSIAESLQNEEKSCNESTKMDTSNDLVPGPSVDEDQATGINLPPSADEMEARIDGPIQDADTDNAEESQSSLGKSKPLPERMDECAMSSRHSSRSDLCNEEVSQSSLEKKCERSDPIEKIPILSRPNSRSDVDNEEESQSSLGKKSKPSPETIDKCPSLSRSGSSFSLDTDLTSALDEDSQNVKSPPDDSRASLQREDICTVCDESSDTDMEKCGRCGESYHRECSLSPTAACPSCNTTPDSISSIVGVTSTSTLTSTDCSEVIKRYINGNQATAIQGVDVYRLLKEEVLHELLIRELPTGGNMNGLRKRLADAVAKNICVVPNAVTKLAAPEELVRCTARYNDLFDEIINTGVSEVKELERYQSRIMHYHRRLSRQCFLGAYEERRKLLVGNFKNLLDLLKAELSNTDKNFQDENNTYDDSPADSPEDEYSCSSPPSPSADLPTSEPPNSLNSP